MARPIKQGLDYFSFDVDFFSDEKISAIRGEFGIKGEIVVIKLLCAIYRNGYFALWSDVFKYGLLNQLPSISEGLLCNIVRRLVEWGFFEKTLFDSANILTSKGIQRRYFEVYRNRLRRRQQGGNDLQYWLLSEEKEDNESYDGVMTRQNPVKTQFCRVKTPQSKVNESKVINTLTLNQETKINNTLRYIGAEQKICSTPTADNGEKQDEFKLNAETEKPPEKLTEFQIVLNTGDMYRIRRTDFDDWVRLYPAVDVPQELRKMEGWANANPKKRKTEKGIRRFINSWLADEQDKGANKTAYAYSANSRVQPLPMSKQQCKPPTIDDCPF